MATHEQYEKAKSYNTEPLYSSLIDTLKINFFHIQSIVIETNTLMRWPSVPKKHPGSGSVCFHVRPWLSPRNEMSLWFAVFPGSSDGKVSACNVGDLGSIPGLGRSPGEGNGNPLQYPCLENSMDGGEWLGHSPWGHRVDMTDRLTHWKIHKEHVHSLMNEANAGNPYSSQEIKYDIG